MSIIHTNAVYYGVHDTTPTQQSVLAALAYRFNIKDRKCFPSIDMLCNMTHLGRSTVIRALKDLHDMKYISWTSGGKNGDCYYRNKYALYLPIQDAEGDDTGGDDPSQSDTSPVPQLDSPCPAAGLPPSQSGTTPVPLRDTINNIKIKETLTNNPTNNGKDGLMDGDFNFSSNKGQKGHGGKKQKEEESQQIDKETKRGFDDFWNGYPDECRCKTEMTKHSALQTYEQARAASGDGKKFDATIRASLLTWLKSKQWSAENGRFIPAPLNFILKNYWKKMPKVDERPLEMANSNEEKEEKRAALAKEIEDLVRNGYNVWHLCEDRCANFVDGKCCEGAPFPPEFAHNPNPPESCSRFKSRED